GGGQAKDAGGDYRQLAMRAGVTRVELQPAVLDIEIARTVLRPLEVREQLARSELRADEPDRAGDENREEEEIQFRHRASGSILSGKGKQGAEVRSATRSVAQRVRGLALRSGAEVRLSRVDYNGVSGVLG